MRTMLSDIFAGIICLLIGVIIFCGYLYYPFNKPNNYSERCEYWVSVKETCETAKPQSLQEVKNISKLKTEAIINLKKCSE